MVDRLVTLGFVKYSSDFSSLLQIVSGLIVVSFLMIIQHIKRMFEHGSRYSNIPNINYLVHV